MKKKIYNKKGFWSGIVCLVLAIIGIFVLIPNYYHDMKIARMIKSIVIDIILLLIGTTSINRSLDYKKTKDDEREEDEREQLIVLKSSQTSLIITEYSCIVLMVLFSIIWYFTKIEAILGTIVGLGLIWNIAIFSNLIAYFHHDKRN